MATCSVLAAVLSHHIVVVGFAYSICWTVCQRLSLFYPAHVSCIDRHRVLRLLCCNVVREQSRLACINFAQLREQNATRTALGCLSLDSELQDICCTISVRNSMEGICDCICCFAHNLVCACITGIKWACQQFRVKGSPSLFSFAPLVRVCRTLHAVATLCQPLASVDSSLYWRERASLCVSLHCST